MQPMTIETSLDLDRRVAFHTRLTADGPPLAPKTFELLDEGGVVGAQPFAILLEHGEAD